MHLFLVGHTIRVSSRTTYVFQAFDPFLQVGCAATTMMVTFEVSIDCAEDTTDHVGWGLVCDVVFCEIAIEDVT